MREYVAFTKKEFLEQLRTYKWLIIFSVFFLFGMIIPLLAKLMPEIFKNMNLEGMKIILPEPTALDAFSQFFKNFTQMGILVLLLVFGGTLSNELERGTLINVLAKGLPRSTVILSKYTAALILWTGGYILATATAFGYTVYLFKKVEVNHPVFSFFCLWLFGCFVIALIILSSTVTSGNFGGLILSAVILGCLLIINTLPMGGKLNPLTLASVNMSLINGSKEVRELMVTVIFTGILIALCLYTSIVLFRKKRL
jgi:ABC-2 type transport system permease protein